MPPLHPNAIMAKQHIAQKATAWFGFVKSSSSQSSIQKLPSFAPNMKALVGSPSTPSLCRYTRPAAKQPPQDKPEPHRHESVGYRAYKTTNDVAMIDLRVQQLFIT